MKKQSPFSLFIRQALLYPLASPFLPPIDKVQKDFSYSAGQLVGTLEAGPVELTWQPIATYGPVDWDDANTYAEYLDADGVTVDETPQNIWTLPTESQLLARLSDEYVINTQSQVFLPGYNYWSSSTYAYDLDIAWYASSYGRDISYGSSYKSIPVNLVRCVH